MSPTPASRRKAASHVPAVGPTSASAGASAPALALYQQIKDHISRKIQDGSWPAGHRLPSEHELVAQFGISRMTVNRALRELSEQGRIVRVAGVGSFVAEEKPQSTLLQIANLASEIRQRGHDYRCQMLTVERISASMEVAAALDLRLGDSVFHSVCVHLEDGVPVQLEDRYVNPRVAPDFGAQDFTQMQPSEYLVRHVPFDQVEHVVDAVLPTTEQAEQLDMQPQQPCLLLTRRTWTRGVPVTVVRCLHPASRYRLGSRFRADGNPVFG
ncbi:histidine utilization repressor [Curvibacter sp. HBC28]|uniref:Histidine utilization repressor n=1 Tax=Curvibacter microcysteis TaxID=3026419 RepID=A0ABT5MD94_9BURK|nr:histidine utilization repressor [Curvibacter sp. HBC28]MDD0814386.1 histidine utilization repressor [Curvibacter sp. HBC28]